MTPGSAGAPGYVGRFAPSPTGPLHAGSLVAALASCLDARAHGGRWLLRIEDLDPPREMPGASRSIIDTLAAFGFEHDGPVEFQSTRHVHYQRAFDRLEAAGWIYPCACTRREIADSIARRGDPRGRHGELVYPGTCRNGIAAGRAPRAWRLRVDDTVIDWTDRNGTRIREALGREVGDFVLKRADGLWAYQLAVVVDDALQGVTDVVRGEDLIGSTARQIHLQRCLGVPTPRYLHVPVVTDAHGEKLSKQTGATALDASRPLPALEAAMRHLGLPDTGADCLGGFWQTAVRRWRESRWWDRNSGEDRPHPAE
ncbi:MAG: glutamyl-queuosine tRNA(Asp) synthetase [Pseudomonadota bacterium]|jgi:glutamyl-Q tRNA(Asp) synthetase